MTAPAAVFRCDASPEMGGGHAMRCTALAMALRAAGWRTAFATQPGTSETVPAVLRCAEDHLVLGDRADEEPAAVSARWPAGVDLLVVDHYGRDAAFERACRPWAKRILVIDDLADRPHDCDGLLDQTYGRAARDYDGLVPESCDRLIGAGFALLRPEFAGARDSAFARRDHSGRAHRVFVSMGLGDPGGLTPLVLEQILAVGRDLAVDVVAASSARSVGEVLEAARRQPAITPHIDADAARMARLMVDADFAVGAGGTSSWERCCLALPSIVLTLADNQREIVRLLAEAGAICEGPPPDRPGFGEMLRDQVCQLTDDAQSRRRLARQSSEVCDGRGAERVLAWLARRDPGALDPSLASSTV